MMEHDAPMTAIDACRAIKLAIVSAVSKNLCHPGNYLGGPLSTTIQEMLRRQGPDNNNGLTGRDVAMRLKLAFSTDEGSDNTVRLEDDILDELIGCGPPEHSPRVPSTLNKLTEAARDIDVQYWDLFCSGYDRCKGNDNLWNSYYYRHTTEYLR